MKKLYYIVILCMIISTNFISAQTFYPAFTIDSTYAQYSNVENTGNDAVQYSNSGLDMKVMVWDGDNPTFYWRLDDDDNQVIYSGYLPIDTNSSANQLVRDPDVVLSEGGAVALIVYEKGDSIYVCSKEFVSNQFQHKFGPFAFGKGSNPNVDAAHRYLDIRCVVTWEYDNAIFTKGTNIDGVDTTATLVLKPTDGDPDYSRPDVAVYYYAQQTVVVSYIFAFEKPNDNWGFRVEQHYIDSIFDPTRAFMDTLKNPDRTPKLGPFSDMTVGYPRIAAPAVQQDPFDFSAVVDVHYLYDFIGEYVWEIWNITYFNNNFDSIVKINRQYFPPDVATHNYQNRKPVISYCGDNIHVAWEYYDDPCYILPNPRWQIIKLTLFLTGIPADHYSVVNRWIFNNHHIPSIAGRFTIHNEVFYTFYDSDNREISCKSSDAGNINLRKGKPKPRISLYPNPTSGVVYCSISDTDELTTMQVFDLYGRLIHSSDRISDEATIDLSLYRSGMYIFILRTGDKTETFKVLKK